MIDNQQLIQHATEKQLAIFATYLHAVTEGFDPNHLEHFQKHVGNLITHPDQVGHDPYDSSVEDLNQKLLNIRRIITAGTDGSQLDDDVLDILSKQDEMYEATDEIEPTAAETNPNRNKVEKTVRLAAPALLQQELAKIIIQQFKSEWNKTWPDAPAIPNQFNFLTDSQSDRTELSKNLKGICQLMDQLLQTELSHKTSLKDFVESCVQQTADPEFPPAPLEPDWIDTYCSENNTFTETQLLQQNWQTTSLGENLQSVLEWAIHHDHIPLAYDIAHRRTDESKLANFKKPERYLNDAGINRHIYTMLTSPARHKPEVYVSLWSGILNSWFKNKIQDVIHHADLAKLNHFYAQYAKEPFAYCFHAVTLDALTDLYTDTPAGTIQQGLPYFSALGQLQLAAQLVNTAPEEVLAPQAGIDYTPRVSTDEDTNTWERLTSENYETWDIQLITGLLAPNLTEITEYFPTREEVNAGKAVLENLSLAGEPKSDAILFNLRIRDHLRINKESLSRRESELQQINDGQPIVTKNPQTGKAEEVSKETIEKAIQTHKQRISDICQLVNECIEAHLKAINSDDYGKGSWTHFTVLNTVIQNACTPPALREIVPDPLWSIDDPKGWKFDRRLFSSELKPALRKVEAAMREKIRHLYGKTKTINLAKKTHILMKAKNGGKEKALQIIQAINDNTRAILKIWERGSQTPLFKTIEGIRTFLTMNPMLRQDSSIYSAMADQRNVISSGDANTWKRIDAEINQLIVSHQSQGSHHEEETAKGWQRIKAAKGIAKIGAFFKAFFIDVMGRFFTWLIPSLKKDKGTSSPIEENNAYDDASSMPAMSDTDDDYDEQDLSSDADLDAEELAGAAEPAMPAVRSDDNIYTVPESGAIQPASAPSSDVVDVVLGSGYTVRQVREVVADDQTKGDEAHPASSAAIPNTANEEQGSEGAPAYQTLVVQTAATNNKLVLYAVPNQGVPEQDSAAGDLNNNDADQTTYAVVAQALHDNTATNGDTAAGGIIVAASDFPPKPPTPLLLSDDASSDGTHSDADDESEEEDLPLPPTPTRTYNPADLPPMASGQGQETPGAGGDTRTQLAAQPGQLEANEAEEGSLGVTNLGSGGAT